MKKSKQLLLLTGPSCVGKSTLIKVIKNKTLDSSIYQKLKIPNLFSIPIFEDDDIPQIKNKRIETSMILHYDLYNNYLDQNKHSNISEIIEQFDEVIVATLYLPSKMFLYRMQIRIIKTLIRICVRPAKYKLQARYLGYQWTKYQGYRKINTVKNLYLDWFDFTKTLDLSKHFIINSSQKNLQIEYLETSDIDKLLN